MAQYEMTAADLECGVEDREQAGCQKDSKPWTWRAFGIIILVAFCAMACLFFTLYIKREEQGDSHTEAQISSETAEHQEALKHLAGRAKAAIHLLGELQEPTEEDSVHWRADVGQSFVKGELTLDKNQIVIPRSGLYFVYSQASYNLNCSPLEDQEQESERSLPLNFYILRWSNSIGDTKPLLHAERSVCPTALNHPSDSRRTYEAIYMGAVFELLAGDKLSTMMSHLVDMDLEDGKTFFGLFAL